MGKERENTGRCTKGEGLKGKKRCKRWRLYMGEVPVIWGRRLEKRNGLGGMALWGKQMGRSVEMERECR